MKRCCLGHGWECLQWQYYWIAQEKTHSMHMPPTHPPCTRIHTTHTQTHKHTHSNTQTHTCPPLLAQHANTKEPRTHRRKFSNVNKRKPKKKPMQTEKQKQVLTSNQQKCLLNDEAVLSWARVRMSTISIHFRKKTRKCSKNTKKATESTQEPWLGKTCSNKNTTQSINTERN